ncbi:MAG: winged helix-turn-helix domain-containing protein [Halanaeroarchaeum sp.]
MSRREPVDAETEDPAQAFALVGNETRAAILRELVEDPHAGLSFSTLRERVDPEMDSSRFNYHLQQLVGQFVSHDEDGYAMRTEGLSLARAIIAGSYDRQVTVEPFDAGFDCYHCGTRVEASYDDGMVTLVCPDCEQTYTDTSAPPSAVAGSDPEAVLHQIDQYNRHRIMAVARGVCPVCVTQMDGEFRPGTEAPMTGGDSFEYLLRRTCPHCGTQQYMTVGLALLHQPELVTFFTRRGVDVVDTPMWHLPFAMTDDHVSVHAEDPLRLALTVTADGDELTLVVDEDVTVVDSTVEPA